MQVQDLLSNLNLISEKLFKSVEGQVYELLDKILIITPGILKEEPLKNIFFENKINGIIIIANSLIFFYLIYYSFTQLLSLYNGNKSENIYSFIIKLIIVSVLINNSYFICEQILNIFATFTDSITLFTKELSGKEISFISLKENILSIRNFMKNDLLSLDGIIKGVISFGAVSILINFSIRYVTIIFLLIISPIAFVTMSSELTNGIFKAWGKIFVTNLITQVIVKLIIFIPIMYKDINSLMYKIILVGSIYMLYNINNFTREILSKITTETSKYNIFKDR